MRKMNQVSFTAKEMKTLLIEDQMVGNCEVIMLHDLENKRSWYEYRSEGDYREWVILQVNAFRSQGYEIFNNADIKINKKEE